MARRAKQNLYKSATYVGSLGASLDEIGLKPLGLRVEVKAGLSFDSSTSKPKAGQRQQQD